MIGVADDGFLARLGITDRATGLEAARRSRQQLIDAGKHVLGQTGDYTLAVFVFSGLLARAQGFHEGTVAAIEAENPYATFTLLRGYAENAAAALYVRNHPEGIRTYWIDPDGPHVSPGRMINEAEQRLKGFAPIYKQLCQYAHPAGRSIVASHSLGGEDGRTVSWGSAPAFKSERDALVACGWVVELAEANAHLLVELADTLIFGRTPGQGPSALPEDQVPDGD
jgi:hypothetical protein